MQIQTHTKYKDVVGHSTGKILTKFWRVMGAAAMIIMMGSLFMVMMRMMGEMRDMKVIAALCT